MLGEIRIYKRIMVNKIRNSLRILGPTTLSMIGLIAVPDTARAFDCSRISQTIVPSQGEVPASLSSIFWTASPNSEQAADPASIVSFVRIDDSGASTSLPFRIEPTRLGTLTVTSIVPEQPLVEGQRYRVVANPLNGDNLDPAKDFDTSDFKASASLDLPTTSNLGVLKLKSGIKRERLSFISYGGEVEFPAVFQDIELEVSPELGPWQAALVFETLVDGETWKEPRPMCSNRLGASWKGRGMDRVFASCGTPEENKLVRSGVAQGEHTLQFRARLAGSTQVFLSSELRVKFDCQPDASSDTGTTGTSGAVGTSGSSEPDGTQTSGGTGGGSPGSDKSQGGTCSMLDHGSRDPSWCLGILVILGSGWMPRRRR